MEQLCIQSYLAQGYPVHLYCYNKLEGVPEGTTIRDGREILPAEEIFSYRSGPGKGSSAAFADFFRYKLLLEHGGWWSDLDVVCLRRLDFQELHVVGQQRSPNSSLQANGGLMKAPAGSPLMSYCWDACQAIDKGTLRWGEIGPDLLDRAIEDSNVPVHVLSPQVFHPIDYWDFLQLVGNSELPKDAYSIHLWHEKWRRKQLDPDGQYPPTCIYEQLKKRFGIVAPQTVSKRKGNVVLLLKKFLGAK